MYSIIFGTSQQPVAGVSKPVIRYPLQNTCLFVSKQVDLFLVWEAPVMTGLYIPTNSPLTAVRRWRRWGVKVPQISPLVLYLFPDRDRMRSSNPLLRRPWIREISYREPFGENGKQTTQAQHMTIISCIIIIITASLKFVSILTSTIIITTIIIITIRH